MKPRKISQILEERMSGHDWNFHYDREKETFRIEDPLSKKGITIGLNEIAARYETSKEQAIDEVVYHAEEALLAMKKEGTLDGKEKAVFPVIRSTSFPEKTSEDIPLIFDEHTAETRIFYALDMGKTYRLIDQAMMEKEGWTKKRIKETALFNLRSLPASFKEDRVAGNVFYFFRANDGYDASRVLNESLLESFKERISGTMALALPHQDVLIIADVQNETGYDILAQMTMSFFASGRVPVTALSFLYEEGELEPIFILGKNRANTPKDGKEE
ncbi:DUF1444 domain-containing protein [Bacillus sp. FJAT-42376]|uniref:DUF1444 domain-containing protein n=1 Tax=Bacillus sp. FJAT-42376 TaxID=2014076 RepID=UPI000F4EAF90|nr:DUF1444 domain-containing protein [Bacillus sp. FJAT-42376]AZB43979.1 DUF1444 domain-containing protein [Bacillus sp. FJAT-42376]